MKYFSLKDIYKRHNDWIGIVSSWVDEYAEDIVQDMYVKIAELNKEEVNSSYIYLTLRSLTLNICYKNNQKPKVDIDKTVLKVESNIEEEKAYGRLFDKIISEANKWSKFDRHLFIMYLVTGYSMRQIEEKTGVTLDTIFYTLKKCKERIKESVGEDYEDYINQDFELIL